MPDRPVLGPVRDAVVSGRGILDADMTTLGGWLRDGWRWWVAELAELVPERWRQGGGRGARVRFDGAVLGHARAGRSVTVALDRGLCLVRTIERPVMTARDAERMLEFDADRLMPMGAAMIVAGRVIARAGPTMQVAVAGLPRDRAVALAEAVAANRITPLRVVVETGAGAVDLLPAMRRAGLFARDRRAARAWWLVVAFLFATNLGLLIWRDAARTDALAQLVEGQRPAVTASRAIGARLSGAERIAAAVRARRAAHDPLALLGSVSVALPAGAWVQRFAWDGESVKLAGYRPRSANVVTALRTAPAFASVRNASSDAVAEVPAGQPFDVVAQVRGGRR